MLRAVAFLIGCVIGLGVVLGLWFGVWSIWEWVTPLAWHVANYWQFCGIMVLIGVVVSWLKAISKAEAG